MIDTAREILLSLWNDEGLRCLMRPDQIRRIEAFLKEEEENELPTRYANAPPSATEG